MLEAKLVSGTATISKHCHVLLNVSPIHSDITEITCGSNKHGRRLRVGELDLKPSLEQPLPLIKVKPGFERFTEMMELAFKVSEIH